MASIVWETPDTPITTQDFVLRHGKRFVKPYFFEFKAHVKERWNKKTIVGLFADEFRQRPLQYYVQAVNAGRIVVNGEKVTTEYHVRTSQTLSHFVHRHEPPVMDEIVEILELTPDVVIVCKPSSVPVHACGQYRKNTVLGILEAEHKLGILYPIHRLDRLVSGLLILARNSSTADKFRQEIEAGTVSKSYIAKVRGVFPEDEIELNAAVVYCPREGKSTCEEHTKKKADDISNECNDSILSCKGKGKSSVTRFKRLYTDGLHSIVECMPLTGRTHQIRVHLQYLGHPIANDALYAYPNPPKRTEVGTNAERAARLTNEDAIIVSGPQNRSRTKRRKVDLDNIDVLKDSNEGLKDDIESELEDNGHDVDFLLDPLCTHCPNLAPSGYETDEVGLWLHCKTYSGKGWKYECPLPKWAKLQNSTE